MTRQLHVSMLTSSQRFERSVGPVVPMISNRAIVTSDTGAFTDLPGVAILRHR